MTAAQEQDVIPIILWCVPRSVSTATERAFMTRDDTRVWHEPLGDPFYFSSQRQCLRYTEEEAKSSGHWDSNIVDVMKKLLDPKEADKGANKSAPVKHIFIKDMAQYIMPADLLKKIHSGSRVYQTSGTPGSRSHGLDPDAEVIANPTVIPTELLRRFKHTFLVRTPQKAVPSYWKCVQEKAAGFEYFDGAEAGFEELRILYKWISNPNSTFNKAPQEHEGSTKFAGAVQTQPLPPPLVDASVLLAHPTETIKHLCDSTGVPFDPAMLSWEAGPQAEFAKWGTYHKGAENSTGFKAETPIARQAAKAAKKAEKTADATTASSASEFETKKEDLLPQEVTDTITRNMEPYNWLFARRTIKAPSFQ